jgi:phosphoribosylformimino-5-aminoimidazole carboxamide ribotide isomerase
MEIIPAIDLRGGQVVRLVQGDFARETRYAPDPAAVAALWEAQGARRLHLVDLDGARAGVPGNQAALSAIFGRIRIPAEVGGGLRSLDAIRAVLDLGAAAAVIGTAAVSDPKLLEAACATFPGRIILGLDARQGRVAVQGWKDVTELTAIEVARSCRALPLQALIYTDIARDGMLEGPNLPELSAIAKDSGPPVIASGGIASVAHIRSLRALEPVGVTGAIIGKALYDGALTLAAALAAGQS